MAPKNGNIREKDKHPGHAHIVKNQRCSQRDQLQKKSFLARSQSSEFQQNKTDFDPLQAMNTLACSYVSCPSEKSTLYSPSIKAWTALSTLLSNCCNTKTISLLLLFGTIDRIALIWKEKREDSNMQVYHYHVENTVTMQMHAYINAYHIQQYCFILICSPYLAHAIKGNNFKRPNRQLVPSKPEAKSLSHTWRNHLTKLTLIWP